MASNPTIRVLLKTNLKKIKVVGHNLRYEAPLLKIKRQYRNYKTLQFQCRDYARKYRWPKKRKVLGLIQSKGRPIRFQNEFLMGKVQIISSRKKGRCHLVNIVSMGHYISSLLSKEVNNKWPLEVLKAQAIAARSYAFYKMKRSKAGSFYDVVNSEKDQVTGDFFDVTRKTMLATKKTRGMVLTHKNLLMPIFYHAKCGGIIFRPDQVWKNKVPGYVMRSCPFCRGRGKGHWRKKINAKAFFKSFNGISRRGDYIGSAHFVSDRSGRSKIRYYLNGDLYQVPKSRFRKLYTRKHVRSNNFKLIYDNNTFYINGKGLGHGVGMCQVGALVQAEIGKDHQEILKYYYPNFKLKKIY